MISFAELEAKGKGNIVPHVLPEATDICTICYTSGTTGKPKGAILSHANMVSNIASVLHHGFEANTDDVHISFLPLAHMFERMVHHLLISCGAAIAYSRGVRLVRKGI